MIASAAITIAMALPAAAQPRSTVTVVPPGRAGAAMAASLRRFHYDTALPMSAYATAPLLRPPSPEMILFETDWPQVKTAGIAEQVAAMQSDPKLDPVLLPRIMSKMRGRSFRGCSRLMQDRRLRQKRV